MAFIAPVLFASARSSALSANASVSTRPTSIKSQQCSFLGERFAARASFAPVVFSVPRLFVVCHGPPGHGHGNGQSSGPLTFVDEMRAIAMKLHTKSQAKEGEAKEDSIPLSEWRPTKDNYVQFLVDSQLMYNTIEDIMTKASKPEYALFQNTGLERSEALAKDIEWFKAQNVAIPEPDEPGRFYADLLKKLAEEDPPAFICHFYNIYFAHSAGGRMIGQKMSDLVLDGHSLNFYKWDGDLKELLTDVKARIEKAASGWSREQKDHCLNETGLSFTYSGQILSLLARAAAKAPA
eukprot:CAMPEP_0184652116 /NCGR_PEP_ID=MMETSP0308-20130426/9789_1 /TAXON_ID=38269 /ORGANISM="Gloeochaete witrockiana, Strain SAG 46.84" /LENGTH=293 /DNA_ID=CAMNT_0027086791 /DNA_START=78 /DNA_END=959 /DNA_ORIENTATION=-